jgi:hypothetical protein
VVLVLDVFVVDLIGADSLRVVSVRGTAGGVAIETVSDVMVVPNDSNPSDSSHLLDNI